MVSVVPPGRGYADGTVTFQQNGMAIGTATLTAGLMATFATSGLSVGVDSISAIYGGNSYFAGQLTWSLAEQEITATTTLHPHALRHEAHWPRRKRLPLGQHPTWLTASPQP